MTSRTLRVLLLALAGIAMSCTGADGLDGSSCTVTEDAAAGTRTITCEDGTTVTLPSATDGVDGTPGVDGTDCTVTDNGDGTKTITCDDGTSVTVNDGEPGTNAGEGEGLDVEVTASSPAGGFFGAGDAIVLTITLMDGEGQPLFLDNLGRANLYMYGPQDVLAVETASALLNASLDRAAADRQHHYINLKTTTNANLVVADNVLTYTLEGITDEAAGTYTATVWATRADDSLVQVFPSVDVQLGTADTEASIVAGCASCHEATNGVMYMHHVDQSSRGQGNPAIDSVPITTCLSCHNNEGYAAYTRCSDGTRPPCAGGATEEKVSDHIVRRVHGLHNGRNLTTPFNVGPGGDFEDYESLHFPANILNCTSCHTDDSWAARPSRLACGSCHDSVDFAAGTIDPPRVESLFANVGTGDCAPDGGGVRPACPTSYTCNTGTDNCERSAHGGGIASNDTGCAGCHSSTPGAGLSPIPDRHDPTPATSALTATLTLSAPASGTFYTDETPVLTIQVDDAGGSPIDPNTWTQSTGFYRAQLFVSGPRADTRPVLTTAAALPAAATLGYYRSNDLRERTVSTDNDPAITRTSTQLRYQLGSVTGLEPGTYTAFMRFRPSRADSYTLAITQFQIGTATAEDVIATNCGDCHADTQMHGLPMDTDLCKSCHDYDRQRLGRTGWTDSNAGYGAAPLSRRIHGVHYGHYLENPDELHSTWDGDAPGRIIFPHDVRSCGTCHSVSDSWMDAPGRVACLGCHDSTAAQAHGTLNTIDPTPTEPYSGDETEACATCHGADRDFSAETVHNITTPYRPPYFR